MRITYVGNFTQPHCTEVWIARTLEQMGHNVSRVQENAYTPAKLTSYLRSADMDMFLFTRTWGETVHRDHLELLRARKIPSVSYHLDLYVGLQRGGVHDPKSASNIGTDPFWLTDYVFSPDGDPESQKFFEANGINHRWLLPGVVADECYIANAPIEQDIIFVGSRSYHSEWPWRSQLISWLEATYGDRFAWHGRPGRPVRNAALNLLYASSRIAIGDSLALNFSHQGYCSDRRYIAPGCGAFQIEPDIPGLNDGFVHGVNACLYKHGDLDDLRQKIDYYLTHDQERENLRHAAHEFVKNNHTCAHRMGQMFRILRQEGALNA